MSNHSSTSAATNPAQPMITAKATIERQATEAARSGQSLDDACPYPFASEAGVHFKAVYLLALPKGAAQNEGGAA